MKIFIGGIIGFCFLFFSCKENSVQVNKALVLAEGNRVELEKLLKHYENDFEKLEAARFLIANMPGNFSVDPQIVAECHPFYEMYDSLNCEFNHVISHSWGIIVDSLWGKFGNERSISQIYISDVHSLKAEQLIKEIELAFCAWKENVYARNCSFDDFCEYILPYRRQNGLVIDDARQIFYKRHSGVFFAHKGADFREEIDSLLYQYRHLNHSQFWGTKIPIWNARTLDKLKHGLCAQRCWYNSILLSSLGMPVAVDFVPAWGNRNNSHTWNIVKIDGKSYAFEAFWDIDRWKYNRIYNNREIDSVWGKFRLPKVYRHTYSSHLVGPAIDKEVKKEDIPELFLNMKKKDVSSEYFETTDVIVELTREMPKGAKFAYLAVYNYRQWYPVQWGYITDGKATFSNMGNDIVYLPVYYRNGSILPAAAPFWLKTDGSIEWLEAGTKSERLSTRLLTGFSCYSDNLNYMACMADAEIYGMENGKVSERLHTVDTLLFERTFMPISSRKLYRFIRLQLPSDSISLGELAFYSDGRKIKGLEVISPISSYNKDSSICMLTDGLDATLYKGKVSNRFVDIDLHGEYVIMGVSMTPCSFSQMYASDDLELMYWSDGYWQSVGPKCRGTGDFLIFNEVPKNALFLLKNVQFGDRGYERIFVSREGSIEWK